VKIFVTSYLDVEATRVAARLRELYHLSDKRHSLVDNPESADVILVGSIGNSRQEDQYLKAVVRCDVIDDYPSKCFSLSYRDRPVVFNRGLYESAIRSVAGWGRVRTGSYALAGSFNPYAKRHTSADADYEGKRYLLSFIGRRSHPVRAEIFALHFSRPDVLIEDSSEFSIWTSEDETEKDRRRRYFYETLLRSKFALCPRGSGAGSIRLFESMKLGVAPIIVSDGWVTPTCPEWARFAIIVKQRHVAELERVVLSYEASYKEMGRLARACYEKYFADPVYFNYAVDSCIEIARGQVIPESVYWRSRRVISLSLRLTRVTRTILTRLRGCVAA
jgi:hypothetical protein